MSWKDNLEGESLDIANSESKRLRVMAGPGTGKTYAMKKRIMRLIEEKNVKPEKILAVTFTRTAASDLKKELQMGIPGATKIHAMTLHSFCFQLLNNKEVFEKLQRKPRPLKTFNSRGSPQFELSPLLSDLDLVNDFGNKREKFKKIKAFEAAWARTQNEALWLQNELDKQFHHELEKWLKTHDSMLIGELIPLSLRYIQNNPASDIFEKYEHIIVDEYQDLNKAEQTLIDLLSERCNLSIVGDADQSIYSFRYAHFNGIEDFSTRHENVEDRKLNHCRRCEKKIVSLADSLIKNNHPGINTNRLIASTDKNDGTIRIIQWKNADEENKGIAQFVKSLIDSSHYQAKDILILSPRRILGYELRDAIGDLGIAVHSFFHEESVEAEEAQKSITLLNLLINPEDPVSLRYWLGMGSNDWLANQYKIIANIANKEQKNIFDVLNECTNGRKIKGIANLLKSYNLLLSEKSKISSLQTLDLIDYLFPRDKEETQILREASSIILDKNPLLTSDELWEYLENILTQPEMPDEGDFVRIMSLHKSKGLTSKVTIITSCIQGLIPNINDDLNITERENALQEQRRLFYVAITRAKKYLVISSFNKIDAKIAYKIGAKFSGRGKSCETIASEFIQQLGQDCPETILGSKWESDNFN